MEISAEEALDGKRECLRVARTLRDKLDGLITSGATDLETPRKILLDVSQELDLVLANKARRRSDEISTCRRSCYPQSLNPALWSTLPMELLQRVFAKLPFPNICRLKILSKEWQLSLQSSSSEFNVALKESSPRTLARVTWDLDARSRFGLRLFDGEKNRWHELHADAIRNLANCSLTVSISTFVHMKGAADAGLVCYVEKDFKTSLNSIFVANPMTGVVNRLPNLNLLMYSKLNMMRIVVDRNTCHYKVIVVKRYPLPLVEAEVYDSEVQQWTKPKPSLGRIFGIAHYWGLTGQSTWRAYENGPCAYDCLDGKYYDFGLDREKWFGWDVISYTLMKDRLFVLYWDRKEFAAFISEYYVPGNSTSWEKEKTHSCLPQFFWRDAPGMASRIHACNGFLFAFLVVEVDEYGWVFDADPDPDSDADADADSCMKYEYGWVYNLATYEWRALPRIALGFTQDLPAIFSRTMVCQLHWNIRP